MNVGKKILLAVDHSEASRRAVNYVAEMIGAEPGVCVRLFHVLKPLPPELLEFGGAENPEVEERLERELRKKQEEWLKKSEKAAMPVLESARETLTKAGIPEHAVEIHFSPVGTAKDLVFNILQDARVNRCDTVVVGREFFPWREELTHHHVADELILKSRGLTLWVVE